MKSDNAMVVFVGSVIAWLLGQGWSWLQTRHGETLATAERWAQKAVAAVAVAYPGLTPDLLARRAESELRNTLAKVGIRPNDSQWAHLTEVIHEAVLDYEASRLGPAADNLLKVFRDAGLLEGIATSPLVKVVRDNPATTGQAPQSGTVQVP